MDRLSSKARSENMRRIRSCNTSPEIAVRSLLHRLGYRFRLNVQDLPGKPDIVLPKLRTVVFVHGCFWHQHVRCSDGHIPATRTTYWVAKLKRNTIRDRLHIISLRKLGWNPIVIWECEIANLSRLERRMERILGPRQPPT
jgi:DNA mismatch endonuclease (patch repair protein)